ncbi:hypothetical protein C8R46DRAFT_1221242 [Mycena filopes]|nr:hypothetical protein C8R46DRAFT_1221242 [Mycena filopes]
MSSGAQEHPLPFPLVSLPPSPDLDLEHEDAAEFHPPSGPCHLLRLPLELLAYIIFMACGSYFSDPSSFGRQRHRIMALSRRFQLLVLDLPQLWSSVVVTRYHTVEDVQLELSRSKAAPLSLLIAFSGYFGYLSPRLISAPQTASYRDLFSAILPSLSRCRSMRVNAWDYIAIREFQHWQPQLLCLETLYMPREVLSPALLGPSPLGNLPLFSMLHPGLRVLHCSRLPIPIVAMGSLLHLVSLSLSSFYEDENPVWADFAVLLAGAVNLLNLSLRRLGCALVPHIPPYSPILPSLTTLDVSFGGHTSLAQLVSSLAMPSLELLHIHVFFPEDMAHLSSCSHAMRTVSTFVVDGCDFDPSDLHRVLLDLPALRVASAGSGGRSMVEALLPTQGSPLPAPDLEVLSVLDVPSVNVRSFVDHRTPLSSSLHTLVLWPKHDDDGAGDPHIQYLADKMTVIAGQSDYSPRWKFAVQPAF